MPDRGFLASAPAGPTPATCTYAGTVYPFPGPDARQSRCCVLHRRLRALMWLGRVHSEGEQVHRAGRRGVVAAPASPPGNRRHASGLAVRELTQVCRYILEIQERHGGAPAGRGKRDDAGGEGRLVALRANPGLRAILERLAPHSEGLSSGSTSSCATSTRVVVPGMDQIPKNGEGEKDEERPLGIWSISVPTSMVASDRENALRAG